MSLRPRTSLPLWVFLLMPACGGDDAGDDAADASTGGSTSAPGSSEDDGSGSSTAADSGSSDGGSSTTGAGSDVPEFGATLVDIATADHGLAVPRDLEFAPEHPEQLWVVNGAIHGVVIITDPGLPSQTAEVRVDAYGQHFMSYVSSLAFGVGNRFSSCQESRDDWNVGPQRPDDFMGPTLWSADLDIFAAVNQDFPPNPLEGSHLDMLHQSPLCMGIAHESDNVYWAFDGGNGHIVRYDFQMDHGPGGASHADGVIRRYLNAVVTRVPEIPGHLVLDPDSRRLYIADTGTGRVMWLDIDSGASNGPLPNNWDGATEYSGYDGATFEPLVGGGLQQPSGLALHDGRLLVSDAATGEIVAFDLDGNELGRMSTDAQAIMGLAVGPDAKLYFTDGFGNRVVRVDP
ncbi:MAG: hypothetical protein K1X88_10080 [Nannocystaceae bacterium]|nr:hypothetical protein [Nannocystaceae bacterium]